MNTPTTAVSIETYHAFSKFLHWLMAVLIIVMLGFGLLLEDVPEAWRGLAYGLHKSTGMLILALAFIRVAWRLIKPAPASLKDLSAAIRFASRASHMLLYVLMFAMPFSGWLMSSAAGYPVNVYGLFTMPDLVEKNDALKDIFKASHELIGYALIALISLHASASLWHHFIRKDATLRRMLPTRG